MKNIFIKFLVTIGIISFFKGAENQFSAFAKDGSAKSASKSDTMGGRSGGCGKST